MSRLLAVAVAFGFLVLQAWAAPSVSPSNDTYRYARMTLRVLGESGPAARADALRAYCEENAAWLARGQQVDPGSLTAGYRRNDAVTRCVDASPDGLAPTSPRYDAIFASRIAFPVLAAPLVPVLGVNRALKATSVLLTALGGPVAYVILRLLGLGRPRSALGQGLYYAGPVGWWGSFGLTDGPAVTVSLVTLLAVLVLLRRRYALGTALFVGSIGVGGFLRYPNFVFITLAVLTAAVAGMLTDPRRRRPCCSSSPRPPPGSSDSPSPPRTALVGRRRQSPGHVHRSLHPAQTSRARGDGWPDSTCRTGHSGLRSRRVARGWPPRGRSARSR